MYKTDSRSPELQNNQTQNPDSISSVLIEIFNPLGIDVSLIKSPDLYLRAASWLGVEYRYGHSSKEGIDCSGFVKMVIKGLFVDVPFGGSRDIFNQCIPIDKEQLYEGDLVFFKINKPYISHVGIYLQNNKFIHATTTGGVIISSILEEYYQKYYYASGRLK